MAKQIKEGDGGSHDRGGGDEGTARRRRQGHGDDEEEGEGGEDFGMAATTRAARTRVMVRKKGVLGIGLGNR